jgi:hypothetical protein
MAGTPPHSDIPLPGDTHQHTPNTPQHTPHRRHKHATHTHDAHHTNTTHTTHHLNLLHEHPPRHHTSLSTPWPIHTPNILNSIHTLHTNTTLHNKRLLMHVLPHRTQTHTYHTTHTPHNNPCTISSYERDYTCTSTSTLYPCCTVHMFRCIHTNTSTPTSYMSNTNPCTLLEGQVKFRTMRWLRQENNRWGAGLPPQRLLSCVSRITQA